MISAHLTRSPRLTQHLDCQIIYSSLLTTAMSQSPILSPNGLIHVLAYSPSEGERGVPITVRIHFSPDLADAMYVRLVVGNKALPTKVTELPKVSYGCWQLHAAAPPFDQLQPPNTKVLMSVQALNEESTILDSVTFGEFTYWANGKFLL